MENTAQWIKQTLSNEEWQKLTAEVYHLREQNLELTRKLEKAIEAKEALEEMIDTLVAK